MHYKPVNYLIWIYIVPHVEEAQAWIIIQLDV